MRHGTRACQATCLSGVYVGVFSFAHTPSSADVAFWSLLLTLWCLCFVPAVPSLVLLVPSGGVESGERSENEEQQGCCAEEKKKKSCLPAPKRETTHGTTGRLSSWHQGLWALVGVEPKRKRDRLTGRPFFAHQTCSNP